MTSQVKDTRLQIDRIELPTPFPVGPVNAYLIRSNDEVVLVDCGPKTTEARDGLKAALAGHELEPKDLTALILTHGHVDHVGNAGWLQQSGVPVYAPPHVESWFHPEGRWDAYRREFFRSLYRLQGVPEEDVEIALAELEQLSKFQDPASVDVTLDYGKSCPVLPEFEVLHVPGHAQHALALWNKSSGALVVGDQLLPHISSNALVEPQLDASSGALAKRTKSLLDYRRNFVRLLELEITTVYPGHGEVFAGAGDLIRKRLHGMEERKLEFLSRFTLCREWSAYQLALDYFPHHRKQISLIMSETLGYLDWLCAEGMVREVEVPVKDNEGLLVGAGTTMYWELS